MFNNEKIQRNQPKIQQISHCFKPSHGAFAMDIIGIKEMEKIFLKN